LSSASVIFASGITGNELSLLGALLEGRAVEIFEGITLLLAAYLISFLGMGICWFRVKDTNTAVDQ